jgi:hypothetical protein
VHNKKHTYVKFFNAVFAQRSESIFNVKCLFASRTNETSSNKNTKNLKKHKQTECLFLIQYKHFLETSNTLNDGRTVSFHKAQKDSLIP